MLEYLPDKSLPVLIIIGIGLGALIFLKITFAIYKKVSKRIHPGLRTAIEMILFGIIMAVICPTLEEVAFRGPLVLLFDGFGFWPWFCIVVSAFIFGMLHVRGNLITLTMQKANAPGSAMFDNEEHRRGRGCATFFLGLIFGYLVIRYQSLYAAVLVHGGINMIYTFFLIVLPMLVFRNKLRNLAVYKSKCEGCKWEEEVFAQKGNIEEAAKKTYQKHDAAKNLQILPGMPLPLCRSKRFTITDLENREYSAVRGFPPLLSETIDSLRPAVDSESTVIRKLQFADFLKKAVGEWERQNNGKSEISGNEPEYQVVLATKKNDVLSISKLIYHIEPSDNTWEVSIQGERLKENKVKNTPQARFNVKYSFAIDEDDIDNPEIIIHKLLQHF